MEDAALDFVSWSVAAFARFGEFEGGSGVFGVGRFEAEVGEVFEGCFGLFEGGHAPLGEPALEGDVAGLVSHCAAGEGRVDP